MRPGSNDVLLGFRRHFPTLERSTYLISNSLGAMPREAADDLAEYSRTWTERGVRAWQETWWGLAREVGDSLAPLIGADPGTISMHQNVTLASAIVVSCFDWTGPRNKVVATEMNFPSIRYLYDRFARSLGAEVVEVRSPDGIGIPTDAVLDAIDERTRLVAVDHVLFKSAWIQDAEAICRKAERVGAHVILDAFQSVGTVPVDVRRFGCHFLVGGVLKWLCGGPGGAYLYVRPDLAASLEPRLTGWMAHPEPFDFEGPPMRYAGAPYRFMNGTPNVPGLYAARAGPRLVLEAGVERIRAKSRRQTALLAEAARSEGWRVHAPSDPDRRGGTVAVDCPHAREVKLELLRRDVVVDYRPGAGIRISPHYYNSDEECLRAIAEIREVLATEAWKIHAGARTTVT